MKQTAKDEYINIHVTYCIVLLTIMMFTCVMILMKCTMYYVLIGTVIRIIHSYVQYLLITVLDEPMKQRVLRSYQQLCTNSEVRNANRGIQTY